jgi:SAM-dependent methyltransferase
MSKDPSAGWQERHRRLAELTAAPDARVLDLGCGEGAILQELAGRVGAGGWLLGIDRNPRALATAATALAPGARRWLLICGDLTRPLPIATGSVDRVLCHNTLESLPDPAGLLAASAQGDYLFSVNDSIVVATKEPEEAVHPPSLRSGLRLHRTLRRRAPIREGSRPVRRVRRILHSPRTWGALVTFGRQRSPARC